MQNLDRLQQQLWCLSGDGLLDDARAGAHTYRATSFPWDGNSEEHPDRQAARLRVLTVRVHRARARPAGLLDHDGADR